jgi:hypothetical protein
MAVDHSDMPAQIFCETDQRERVLTSSDDDERERWGDIFQEDLCAVDFFYDGFCGGEDLAGVLEDCAGLQISFDGAVGEDSEVLTHTIARNQRGQNATARTFRTGLQKFHS